MARDGLCPGVLSIGAKHVSAESPAGPLKNGQPLKWEQMWVETRLAPEELAQRGIRAGTRVAIARKHKILWRSARLRLRLQSRTVAPGWRSCSKWAGTCGERRPAQDIYLIASSSEEIGGIGATYALAHPAH